MARIADPDKMEGIKRAVMECVTDFGYAGVSIASICEKAGVSPGYLYRYYKSKEELVQELVDSEMMAIINNFISDIDSSNTLFDAAYKTVKRLFMSANTDPMTAKFTAAVVKDFRIPSEERADNYKSLFELADKCIQLGTKTGEINPDITGVEVLVVSFALPFRYLSFSLELDHEKRFTAEEAERISKICINAFNFQ